MEEFYNKVNNLIDKIDESILVKEIKELNKKVENDSKLKELLEKYHLTQDESIKEQIISNDLFQEFKSKETDLNILIMSINQKLKKIGNGRSCK